MVVLLFALGELTDGEVDENVGGAGVPAEDSLKVLATAGGEVGDVADSAEVLDAAIALGVGEEAGIDGGDEGRALPASGDIGGAKVADGGESTVVGDDGTTTEL